MLSIKEVQSKQKLHYLNSFRKSSMAKKLKEKTAKHIDCPKPQDQWSFYQGDTELGQKINHIFQSGIYAILSTTIMVYTLFSDDVRQLGFPPSADIVFSIITLTCMIYYTIEIVVLSIFQKDYFLKYYFWLDIISTITMAFDLIWITQYLTGGGKNAANITQITRASRAARLGTKTVRLIRLIRMIKIMRQMKMLTKEMNKKQTPVLPKKISQRLSSIHSKITSLRNVEKLNSLRHMEKLPSKRWSLIKQTDCMNFGSKKDAVSLHCLPFQEKDSIIEKQSEPQKKNEGLNHQRPAESTQKMASFNKVADLSPNDGDKLSNLDKIEEEPEKQKDDKIQNIHMSKKSRFDVTRKNINVESDQQIIFLQKQSNVGSKVQSQIQKNVILLIILILISIPLLDGSTWFSSLAVYDQSMSDLVYMAINLPSQYQSRANDYIAYSKNNFLNPLVYFTITTPNLTDTFPDNYPDYSSTISQITSNYRSEDLDYYAGNYYTVAFDINWYNKQISIFSIARTVFVCILLILATMLFSNDLQFAAIAPLQQMFDTVRKIAIHPLNALKQIQERNMFLEDIEGKDESFPNTQPKILLNTIIKIGSLLAIGFGQAGTEIICRVIEDPRIINVMIPGQKIMAIYGFCDIRNFTDATQILQADVMVFVNEIAQICHKCVYEHLGGPNKNIGDAFLLVWKFAQQNYKVTETESQEVIDLIPSNKVRQTADLAVLSLIKMIAEITKSYNMQKYKNNKGLQGRIPNYAGVKMGFGLHMGWSIEGPIGSQYKIDASYLSPHVHMASRLQAGTKGYGATMLITDSVYNIMTENRSNLRHIDRVVATGQTEVMDLYTIDIVPKHLFQEIGPNQPIHLNDKEKRKAKVTQNRNRKALMEDISKQGTTDNLWLDEDIKIMQQPYKEKFFNEFNIGFKHYLSGEWDKALSSLTVAQSFAPEGVDGPTGSLIKFIEEHNGQAPPDWKGHRQFD